MTDLNQITFPATILVVEDNAIIALDAEDMLLSHGASEVLIASSVTEALHFIENQTIDFAVLDMKIGEETSERVGETLLKNETPFIFATGHSNQAALAESFPDVKVVQKPYDGDAIISAMGFN